MSNPHPSSIAVIGLSKSATETLSCLFRLSGQYQLVDFWSADDHDAIVVNINDSAAVQLWQTYKVNNPSVATIVVAKQPGRFSSYPYLPTRFLERPCFAAPVLSVFARVCPLKESTEELSLIDKISNIMMSHYNTLHQKLQVLSQALFRSDDQFYNAYYK